MPTRKRQLLVVLAVGIALLLAGCAEAINDEDDSDIDADDVEAEELEQAATEAMAEVTTFTFETEQTTTAMGAATETTVEGQIDVEAQRAQIETSIDQFGIEQEFDQYIVDETLYMDGLGEMLGTEEWLKVEVGEEAIWEHDEATQQREMLDVGDLSVEDTETFDGHDVYVVELNVSGEDMEDIIEDAEDPLEGEFEDAFGEEDDIDALEYTDVSVTQYIDADSYYVRYSAMEATIETEFGTTAIEMETTFDDFNDAVDVELPPEAEDAMDIDEWLEEWDEPAGNEWSLTTTVDA